MVNTRTQNYQNLVIGFQVTVKNVGDALMGHSVIVICTRNRVPKLGSEIRVIGTHFWH